MMTKRQLYRFAIRAARDPFLAPVLADALLEHPATRAPFEHAIGRAEQSVRTGWTPSPVFVVFFQPAFLSSEVGRRRGERSGLFYIVGKGAGDQSIESFVKTAIRIRRRVGLVVVPVYIATERDASGQ